MSMWDRYCETIIAVETIDGWLDLNGPQAVETLPWAGPIHVLTAWNPNGQPQSTEKNEKWQEALQNDLWAEGQKIHRAFGADRDDISHWEDSVAVEGLKRSEAIRVGARYEQEAIFEVTESHLMVVACKEDEEGYWKVEEMPRRA